MITGKWPARDEGVELEEEVGSGMKGWAWDAILLGSECASAKFSFPSRQWHGGNDEGAAFFKGIKEKRRKKKTRK
jgi:hypothetical protein